jgi:hypothetical protein
VSVIEPDRWGTGKRLPKCLEYLGRYGVHAKAVVPQLKELRRLVVKTKQGKERDEQTKLLDKSIAAIMASRESPTVIDLKDFMPRSAPNK